MNLSQRPDNATHASKGGDNDKPIQQARRALSMGLIIRQKEPHNLETPFSEVPALKGPAAIV